MKVIYGTLMFLLLATQISGLSSCSKIKKMAKKIDDVETKLKTGSWHVTAFSENGVDELSHVSGYTFTFNSNGSVHVSNNIDSYNGSWSVTASGDDDSEENIHLNLSFNYDNFLKDMSEDWTLISHDNARIATKHVSGGNGGTNYLTFEKY